MARGTALFCVAFCVTLAGAGGAAAAPESWMGLAGGDGTVPVTFVSERPGMSVSLLASDRGCTKLGVTPTTQRLAPGRYRFLFEGRGGWSAVTEDVVGPTQVASPKVAYPRAAFERLSPSVALKVLSVAGTARGRSALLDYRGLQLLVEPGFESPDGGFVVREVQGDRVVVSVKPGDRVVTFYL